MLWRDLAARLGGLVWWIGKYRNPGQCVGRLGERIDPIIKELIRLRQDAQDCSGDDPADLRPLQGAADAIVEEGIRRTDPLNRPGAPPRRSEEGR